mgnify:CR=1 FL=1
MKKILTSSLLLLFSMAIVSAQSLQFINPPVGDISRSSSDDTTKTYFQIKNISAAPINVKARRLVTNMATGQDTMHQSFFCWDVCYGTSAGASAYSIMLLPGDTTDVTQYIVLVPNGIPGYSSVTMRFFLEENPGDYIEHTYTYSVDGVTSLTDKAALSQILSAPYPNPAKDHASINYELPAGMANAEIQVYNLIGKKVRSIVLDGFSGTASIPTAGMTSGVYFLYLTAGGKQITSRKLIISK